MESFPRETAGQEPVPAKFLADALWEASAVLFHQIFEIAELRGLGDVTEHSRNSCCPDAPPDTSSHLRSSFSALPQR